MGWEKPTDLFGLQSQSLILAAPSVSTTLETNEDTRLNFFGFLLSHLTSGWVREECCVYPPVWLSSLCSDTISITEDWEVWKVFKTFFLISNQLSCVNQCYCTDSGLTRLLIRTLDRTVIRTLFLSAECSVDSRHEQQGLPPVNSLSLSPGIWDCWE